MFPLSQTDAFPHQSLQVGNYSSQFSPDEHFCPWLLCYLQLNCSTHALCAISVYRIVTFKMSDREGYNFRHTHKTSLFNGQTAALLIWRVHNKTNPVSACAIDEADLSDLKNSCSKHTSSRKFIYMRVLSQAF